MAKLLELPAELHSATLGFGLMASSQESHASQLSQDLLLVRSMMEQLSYPDATAATSYIESLGFSSIRSAEIVWWGTASDSEVVEVVRGHHEEILRQQQHPDTGLSVTMHLGNQMRAQERAVSEGWLHPKLVDSNRLAEVKMYIGDLWSTRFTGRSGYYLPGTNYVVISQGIGKGEYPARTDLLANIDASLPHEFLHFQCMPAVPLWLNEALTSHIDDSLRMGGPDIIDPDVRREQGRGTSGSYQEYRKLAAFITHDLSPVSLTQMYTSGRTQAAEKVHDAVDASWATSGMLEAIEAALKAQEYKIAQDESLTSWAIVRSRAATAVYEELISQQ